MKLNIFRLSRLILCLFLIFQTNIPVLAQHINAEKLQQFEDAILRGEELLGAGKYAEAKAQYQAALKIDPTAQFPKDKLAQIRKVYIDPEDEARFTQFMQTGTQRMAEKRYPEALKAFEAAIEIKPQDRIAREQMSQASKAAIELAERTKSYESLIKKADELLAAGNTDEARESFISARELMPEQSYPQQKIREIDDKTAAELKLKQEYEDALAKGDEAYMNRDFTMARIHYGEALKLKPGESYPTSMLERVSASSKQAQNQQQLYEQTITGADRLMNSGDHQGALSAYESAAKLQPDEKYPQQQIEKIHGLLQQKEHLEKDYQRAIAEGDRLLASENWIEARSEFQQANNLKPAEAYPRQKIEEIAQTLLALKEAERDKSYRESLNEGERLLAEENLLEALHAFEEARQLKPEETRPAERIKEINNLLADQQALLEAYNQTIAAADQHFSTHNYQAAKEAYDRALDLRKGDDYATAQISKTESILRELKLREDEYQGLIEAGDLSFSKNLWNEAKQNYLSASQIFPDREHPKNKLKEIENQLNELRSMEELYVGLITDADARYAATDYEEAAAGYRQALELKPQEIHPRQQLAIIEQVLKEKAAQQQAYQNEIDRADEFYEGGNYQEALSAYAAAIKIIPDKQHPTDRMLRINKILEDRKSLEENYTRYIVEGDKAFANKQYSQAKPAYEQALDLKPGEKHPINQIQLIEKALIAEQALNDSYQQAIEAADRLFNAGSYTDASRQYDGALELKPGETYPREQKQRIEQLLADREQLEKDYAFILAEADRLFETKNYVLALEKYKQLLQLKPGSAQPTERIAAIRKLLGEQQALEQQYESAIAQGDAYLDKNQWDEAITAYKQAKSIKPSEQYPENQLNRIAQLREIEQSKATAYAAAIKSGDASYESKAYEEALKAYQKALENKPDADHPANRIEEINILLQEQKQLADKDYNEAIERADRLFAEKDYNTAVRFYESASALKPAENYPKEKLLSIRTLLQERSRNQMEAYNKLIMNADRLYQDKIFDQAIDAYLEAGLAKPDESYPSTMIAKIRKYLDDHAMVNLVSSPVTIESGDEKKFSFTPIEMRLRKNNYVSIVARKTSEADPKVYVNYGRSAQKNGGIVLRTITSDENGDFLVRVSIQDRWYREDNNWIAIYSEGGSIEISRMQIAQGD